MAANIVGAFEPSMQNAVKTSKILLVGSGGIGCEVLKNLVLMGFGELEVIDLDTIEISNLNRQFLFSKESVGSPKSLIAKESVLRFNPNVNINSHFGDITDKKYGSAFFNKFKLVINALDNKRARSHVNRMCLSCDIPLIESGTMGYSGQVEFIKKDFSLCYECYPKAEPKEYPMCTIRNTPKEPIHCIIWAKFLFGQLFGEVEEDVSMDEQKDGEEKLSAREWAKLNNYDANKLFKKIFYDDIDYLLNMPDLYKSKSIKPVKLDPIYLSGIKSEYLNEPENKVLSLSQYITMFIDSIAPIVTKFQKSNGCLSWDKDDDDCMNFVVSCTNIRSTLFGIVLKSHFDIKSMAGNIIPAIATANAIIAGQIVVHALRVLQGKFDRCQTVFLRGMPNHKGELLVKDKKVEKPNPKCIVCSTGGLISIYTDLYTFTIRQFEDLVLKQKLHVVAPDVVTPDGKLIISSDEEDELNLYSKTLFQADISNGSRLIVEDFLQNYKLQMIVYHKIRASEEHPEFELRGKSDEAENNINTEESRFEESEDEALLYDENSSISEEIDKRTSTSDNDESMGNFEAEDACVTAHENGNMVIENEDKLAGDDSEVLSINNETHSDDTEKLLAPKRKAENDAEIPETKKSRQSTDE